MRELIEAWAKFNFARNEVAKLSYKNVRDRQERYAIFRAEAIARREFQALARAHGYLPREVYGLSEALEDLCSMS